MDKIQAIANEVEQTNLIPRPEQMSNNDIYVAIVQNLATATYVGRKEEFSVVYYRKHMRIAAAYCQASSAISSGAIVKERLRQDSLWGDEFDSKNTANDWLAYVTHYISQALRHGEPYEENMVKAAGLCQAAMLMVDRYGSPAPRHYEGAEKCSLCNGERIRRSAVLHHGCRSIVAYPCPECRPEEKGMTQSEVDEAIKNIPIIDKLSDIGPTTHCVQCGYAMGEQEGVPLCSRCNPKPENGGATMPKRRW